MMKSNASPVPRRAMVLAAGLGVRMRPLSDATPKPLVAVAGKALIDHVLDRLAEAGVEMAVVNVHYLADQVERHLAGRQGPKVVISDERDELLDTGGGVVKALPVLGAAPFFHLNSDAIWIDGVRPNLLRLAEIFDPAHMDALLLLAATSTSVGYAGRGDFTMAPDGRLCRSSMRGSRSSARRCFPQPRLAHSRSICCLIARSRLVGCTACGWKACGCMSGPRRRSPPQKPRSLPAWRDKVPIGESPLAYLAYVTSQ